MELRDRVGMSSPQRTSVLIVGGSRFAASRTRALLETSATAVERCGAAADLWDVGLVARTSPDGVRHALHPSGLQAIATRADAVVLVTPTCHGSYSGLVKHSLDYLDPSALAGKPVALMATCGPVPTPQALDHLRIVVGALGAMAIPSQVVATEGAFRRAGEGYQVTDELLLERVRSVTVELVWFAARLRRVDSPRVQRADFPDQIMRAVEYIRENLSNGPLSLDRVAQEASMSRYHFSRTFKRVTGTRFIDFVTKVRVTQASTMLAETEQSVTAIAFAVGYHGRSPFERTFKRELGLTPSQYRRRVRAGLEVPAVVPSTGAAGMPYVSAAS